MIVLDHVRFGYEAGSPAIVDDLSLQIEDGEHVALLGRNGSGKSTIARLLNGLLRPLSGTIRVDGYDPADAGQAPEVRRRLQLVFQTPENQQVGATVYEDIAFGLANVAVPTDRMPERARQALAAVGLEVDLSRDVDSLSGGELQRLALAGVLALEPRHLVLDEVTAMLDPWGREQVLATVADVGGRSGISVVQITHHLEEIEQVDRVFVMDGGRVRAVGTPAEVLVRTELLEQCGLEPPLRWQLPGPVEVRTTWGSPAAGPALVEAHGVGHDYSIRVRPRWWPQRSRPTTPDDLPAPVLRGADLAIRPGELVAIAGRSGAGKSTLVSIVKGLLRPTVGSVRVRTGDGSAARDPWALRTPELFDPIGYLFQHPEHQLFAPTVREDVGFGLRAARLGKDEERRRVDAQLRRVGLDPDEFGDRSPFELSGGQQRKVALAGVLVTEPRVLILDEPTAGLDKPSRDTLFEILARLRADGLGVLWVSHRLEEIFAHAGRLIVLADGRVLADGDPAELLAARRLRAAMGWPLLPELDPAIVRGEARTRYLEGRRVLDDDLQEVAG